MAIVLLLGGASNAGKTATSARLCAELKHVLVVAQDDFFLPLDKVPRVCVRGVVCADWDSLEALDMDALVARVALLRATPAKFCEDCRGEEDTASVARHVVVVEGTLVVHPRLSFRLAPDQVAYLVADRDLCYRRRELRWLVVQNCHLSTSSRTWRRGCLDMCRESCPLLSTYACCSVNACISTSCFVFLLLFLL